MQLFRWFLICFATSKTDALLEVNINCLVMISSARHIFSKSAGLRIWRMLSQVIAPSKFPPSSRRGKWRILFDRNMLNTLKIFPPWSMEIAIGFSVITSEIATPSSGISLAVIFTTSRSVKIPSNCCSNAIKIQLALASVMAAIATFKGVSGGSTGGLGSIACSSKLWVSETVVDMGKSRGIYAGGTAT